ncbi:hypothetical protein BU17DRAFT_72434 [Hysterangium stoloniferum]|nr:hypothetical protein BU17DRAFT_72434 [Hysterangium stoloniferum]
MGSEGTVQFNEILCIGLEFSGICLGAQLKGKLHVTDIHFYDRNIHVAGTWHATRYPGAACDITAMFYSFSFETNPDWSTLFPDESDIFDYINNVVDKYDLGRRMTLQTECESASWDSERQIWTVHLKSKDPRCGGLWWTDVSHGQVERRSPRRKDVVLIGNGCSGTQIVPHIVPKGKTFMQFIHMPHWLIPATNPQIPLFI